MDWFLKYQAQRDCAKQKITLRGPKVENLIYKGKTSNWGVRLITAIKDKRLLGEVAKGSYVIS